MVRDSLEAGIQAAGGNPIEFLRNVQYPAFEFPVRSEWTNWRDEQRAWRDSCVLFDQSHHMADLFLSGPDAVKALTRLGVNSFANFGPGMAKQYICVNDGGHFVGDGIVVYLPDGTINLVSVPSVINWTHYHLETGGYDIRIERDDNSNRRQGAPRIFRYELQGPAALAVVEKMVGRPLPKVKFFHTTQLAIGGSEYTALRHGMAGQPGFEIFGPWADADKVLEAILDAGAAFGLKRGGAKCYSTANVESGWIPGPFSAVFGEAEKGYREWLPAAAYGSLGGSMDSTDVADYYVTPYDIGYGKVVNFDHDFVGRAALEGLAKQPRRDKVSLLWNPEDVAAALRSWMEPGTPVKYIELPKARYAWFQMDKVLRNGRQVGISMDNGLIPNERAFISLASVDLEHCRPGTELTVLWGENPRSAKPAVEPHRQMEIRATVAPCPFAQVIRDVGYRKS
ncbi:MAG TPA: aminomethyl transferase family protein [Sphingomonadaceae bacterium]|nr:aminomethyl transferase family protein [Sphingomonadaceae bacterium]